MKFIKYYNFNNTYSTKDIIDYHHTINSNSMIIRMNQYCNKEEHWGHAFPPEIIIFYGLYCRSVIVYGKRFVLGINIEL